MSKKESGTKKEKSEWVKPALTARKGNKTEAGTTTGGIESHTPPTAGTKSGS